MKNYAQSVVDNPNNNTIFMVWNFKENIEFQDAFKALCNFGYQS